MIYTLKNDKITVTVSTEAAELQTITAADGTEYLWYGDPKYWKGRAKNIFPYVARLTDGKYIMDGNEYSMTNHGFACHNSYDVVKAADNELVLELTDNEETAKCYPRKFAYRVKYAIDGNKLIYTFEVENRDERTMYFAVGGHPGFNVPLVEGKKFSDYKLRFKNKAEPVQIGFTENYFVSGEETPYVLENGDTIRLEHDLFKDDAIVLKGMDSCVTLESEDDPHKVTVEYPDMKYLGLWHTPNSDAPFVCIEPWCALPSTQDKIAVFEEQEDMVHLEPGKTYTNTWSIKIDF